MIKLYGVPQSRAMRALWMLEELGLPYENVKVNFATGDTRKPEYLRINPNGHIPALQDGDLIIWSRWRSISTSPASTTWGCGRRRSRARAAPSSGASGR